MSLATSEPGPAAGSENGPLTGQDQFVHKLHDPALTKFHTEINWPAPMTGLDVLRGYYRRYGMKSAAKVLDDYADWYRTNMVAYKRKREGVIERVGAAQAAAREQSKSMQELMFGRAMK
jgi:hypothetical protein